MIKPLNQKKIDFLEELYEVIKSRDKSRVKNSYTKLLLKSGKNKIAQKIAEESSELLIDYLFLCMHARTHRAAETHPGPWRRRARYGGQHGPELQFLRVAH